MFLWVVGKSKRGAPVIDTCILENQLEGTATRWFMERPDEIAFIEIRPASDKEFMRFQKDKRKEERGGGARV